MAKAKDVQRGGSSRSWPQPEVEQVDEQPGQGAEQDHREDGRAARSTAPRPSVTPNENREGSEWKLPAFDRNQDDAHEDRGLDQDAGLDTGRGALIGHSAPNPSVLSDEAIKPSPAVATIA